MRHCALLLVGLCWFGCGSSGGKKGDLTVVGSPQGALDGPPRVAITFSRPMVTAAELNKTVAAPPLSFQPKIAGEATWTDDKTLVLVPSEKLPVSTKYVATVPGSEIGRAHV
jgi:hypothetical protein